jgi:hypothetical protein
VTQGGAALDLVKTVGTDVNLCASTNSITVNNGALVTYCFDVTNTGAVTLSLHDLDDDQLGPILSSFSFDLGPGASVFITAATSVGPGDVTNTGTWTGSVIDGPTATDTDTATVTILGPAISLEKTVGTDVNLCAATNTISVVEGTQVTYCYRVENTGGFTLTVHDLIDDQLGVLLTSFPFALGPSQSAFLTASTVIGSASVTNTATWTGSNPPTSQLGGVTAESTDTATVEVVPVPVELQGFDVE